MEVRLTLRVEIHFSTAAVGLSQIPVEWELDNLSPEIKWPWREADQSWPSAVDNKSISIFPYVFVV
jgi:hypothetical protein